jgi:hypothetical protein
MFVATNGSTFVLKPSAKEEKLRFFGKKKPQETRKPLFGEISPRKQPYNPSNQTAIEENAYIER